MLRTLSSRKHQKIVELTSNNNLVIKDARFLSSFIREVEKTIIKVSFSLISS